MELGDLCVPGKHSTKELCPQFRVTAFGPDRPEFNFSLREQQILFNVL